MKTDLEQLKKYESWFSSALYYDYIRALWKADMDVLIPIYERWTGKKSNINGSCGRCKLEFMKKFGKLYFKNKEEYEREQEQVSGQTKGVSNTSGKTDTKRQSKRDSNNVGKGSEPKTNKGTVK